MSLEDFIQQLHFEILIGANCDFRDHGCVGGNFGSYKDMMEETKKGFLIIKKTILDMDNSDQEEEERDDVLMNIYTSIFYYIPVLETMHADARNAFGLRVVMFLRDYQE